jgi:hypothetical protein
VSQWARNNPDAMMEIAELPPAHQRAALRGALPDSIQEDTYDDLRRDAEADVAIEEEEAEPDES